MKNRVKYLSAGLPPESVVFIGNQKVDTIKMEIFDLKNKFSNLIVDDINKLKILNKDKQLWINIKGVHDVSVLEHLGEIYNIHPLIMADIANTEHSPKIDFFEDYLFLEMKIVSYDNTANEVTSEQASFILGSNFLMSFLESHNSCFDSIIARFQSNSNKTDVNPGFLLYSLIDSLVDNYYNILEKMGEDIEEIEDIIMEKPTPKELERLHKVKRDLIYIRKAVWPLREVIRKLDSEATGFFEQGTSIYLRDLYEHIIQIIETVETQREIVAEILDVYLSSVSYKLNEIMKVLTVISTIFMPLTLITSLYGMNFKFMPELDWKFGYPLIWLFMISLSASMLYIFKRKNWF